MRVLITTDWYEPAVNGVVTSVVNLAHGLEAAGHEVRILTLSGSMHSSRTGNVIRLGSIGVGLLYPSARLRLAQSGPCVRALIAWRPDVVHSQCEFSTFSLAKHIAQACGAPLVHTYHTVYEDFTHYFSPSVPLGRRMAAAFSRRVLASAQTVIAPTGKIRALLQGYGVTQPIAVIPTGLALARFCATPNAAARRADRRRLGFADGDRVLLSLGRLAKEKNPQELARLLACQDARVKLLFVGDGPYREQLQKTVRELGLAERVVFAGMVRPEETARYYALGDVFVSASRSETQGLTYAEAMAAGLPLLCRADPCLAGVICDGANGFLYRSGAEFAEKLGRLLGDARLRRTMAAAARQTACSRFSAERFTADVLAAYRRALGAAGRVRKAAD